MEDNKQSNRESEAPGRSQKDGVQDEQQQVREPLEQSHENREHPRDDHGTGHLGYNKTHLDSNPAPVREGSDKI